MKKKFDVLFLKDAIDFLSGLDEKERNKIIYNVDKATFTNDSKLFKKLTDTIWEFRTLYKKKQYRLLAFWDKESKVKTLVISTNGIVKKNV